MSSAMSSDMKPPIQTQTPPLAQTANLEGQANDDAVTAVALVRLQHLFRLSGEGAADQALYRALTAYRKEQAE